MTLTRRYQTPGLLAALALVTALAIGPNALFADPGQSESDNRPFTTAFRLGDCTFKSTGSNNPFFILDPGHQLILIGEEGKEEVEVQITVLKDTENITLPGLGTIKTRVVEEREWADGELAEVSRNFFALCAETRDVFYFGEDVDNYEDGVVVNHDGAWRAGADGAMPGLIMPGTILLGARYFQEIAPGVALDRGENQGMQLMVEAPAGTFMDCVSVFETSALESSARSFKVYAPGVGLIMDDTLALVSWTPAP